EAAVAAADVLPGDDARHLGVASHAEEACLDLGAQLARHGAWRRERRVRVVAHLPGLGERRGEGLGDLRDGVDRLALGGQAGEARGVAAQIRAHLACRREQVAHLDQAPRLEGGALGRGGGERGSEERNVRRGRSARLHLESDQLGEEVEPALGLGRVARRAQREDGTAVHYLHTGPTTLPDALPALERGRLFLLVHAAGSNAGLWRRQLEAAGRDHSALAPDLPGHGRSSGIEGLPTVEAYADFVLAFARALRLRRFVLVGRSMGGAVGLTLAARHPELVEGLVLVCTAACFELAPAAVAGAGDQVTPVGCAEELARGIAGARLEVIPHAGHQAPLEQADAFNRLVAGFAAELP